MSQTKVKPIGERHEPGDGPCCVCGKDTWKIWGKKINAEEPGEYFQNYECANPNCGMECRYKVWKNKALVDLLT